MSNENKKLIQVEFLTVYGPKKSSNEHFNPDDDCTDQRAPVNNPSELYEQFFMNDDVIAEIEDTLRDEKVEDFEDDVYDYEDRSELGEDIALAQSIDLSKIRQSSKSKGQSKSTKKEEKPEDLDDVNDDVNE